jgi:hypothetical protein
MVVNWSEVSAIATAIYGGATLAFVYQIWRDRVQRDRHFNAEAHQRKLNELRTAFYDAVGYWAGHTNRSVHEVDAVQAGKVFEALTRLECQLRLNGYKDEARDLGFGVRKLLGVAERLDQIGTKLGLFDFEYHPVGLIYPKDVS